MKNDLFIKYSDFGKKASIKAIDRALRKANWKNFKASRDISPLRSVLSKIEDKKGVTSLHFFCTSKIENMGARLAYRTPEYRSKNRYTSVRCDGAYAAFFFFVDKECDISIIEMLSGLEVNRLTLRAESDNFDARWSPDGHRIAFFIDDKTFCLLDPFASEVGIKYCTIESACSKSGWCFSPDSTFAAFSVNDRYNGCPLTRVELKNMKIILYNDGFSIPESLSQRINSLDLVLSEKLRWNKELGIIYGTSGLLGVVASFDENSCELVSYSNYRVGIVWSSRSNYLAHLGPCVAMTDSDKNTEIFQNSIVNNAPIAVFTSDKRRLALVMQKNNLSSDILIYDGNFRTGVVETSILNSDQISAGAVLCWSHCSGYMAVLTGKNRLQIWNVSANPYLSSTTEIDNGVRAVIAVCKNNFLVVGDSWLAVVDSKDGSVRCKTDFKLKSKHMLHLDPMKKIHHFVATEGSVVNDFANIYENFSSDALQVFHRLRVGNIICSQQTRFLLKEELCYILHNRYTWPFHWGAGDRVQADVRFDSILVGNEDLMAQRHIIEIDRKNVSFCMTNNRLH
ncbi:MAG TPA: hypothetical protein P5123_02565 [Spirochaetota bacterium]|nr:hypothetical protein [Spirochaetota bacterium]